MRFVANKYTPDAALTAILEAAAPAMVEASVQYAKAKEDCIKTILRQVLNREPVLEDARRMTLARHPIRFSDPVTTSVYFDDVYLGIMTETMDEIKFMPAK